MKNMNKDSLDFLKDIMDFNIEKFWSPEKTSLVIVSHILPDTLDFINVLSKYFNISYIIPKPNSINNEIYKLLNEKYSVLNFSRDQMNWDPNIILEKFNLIRDNVIILDVWGYFSQIYLRLRRESSAKILWIIEDTENWHQKYENNIDIEDDTPILSVARSVLKEHEDLHVGKSIVFSTEYILRENSVIFTNKKSLVLWFWKIWKSISRELFSKNIHTSVYDIDCYKKLEIFSSWYSLPDRDKALSDSDILFCATWNKSLVWEDYLKLKDWVIISTATSSDDELDLSFLKENFEKTKLSKYVDKYTYEWKSIYLLNWWNAVNFTTNEAIWSFIFLIQAEIIHWIFSILNEKQEKWIVRTISNEDKKYIPKIWLQHFNN